MKKENETNEETEVVFVPAFENKTEEGIEDGPENEDVKQLMDDHGIDADTAEKAQDLMDTEGLDEDEAIELAEEL
jgi:hypothetical protein